MDQLLRNNAGRASVTFYDDETAVNVDDDVTVYVYHENGTLLTSGTAATGSSTGVYTFDIPAQSTLDLLTIKWDADIDGLARSEQTELEIAGGFYAQLAEIRNYEAEIADDHSQWSTDALKAARIYAESWFETYCDRAFVPRYARESFTGDGTDELTVSRVDLSALIDVKVDGVTQDLTGWTFDYGTITTTGAFTNGSVVEVRYEHGQPFCPAEVKRAFLKWTRHLLIDAYSRVDDRALSMNVDGIFTQFATANNDRSTGFPEIDAVLNKWRCAKPSTVGAWL